MVQGQAVDVSTAVFRKEECSVSLSEYPGSRAKASLLAEVSKDLILSE